MNEMKEKEIVKGGSGSKNNNGKKKFWGSRIVFVIVCGLIGAVTGFFTASLEDFDSEALKEKLEGMVPVVMDVTAYVFLAFAVVVTIATVVMYFAEKKKALGLLSQDECDELELEWVSYRMNVLVAMPSISIFAAIFSFAYTLFIKFHGQEIFDSTANAVVFWVELGIFWIVLIANSIMISLAIKLLKKINPEKKGDVYSFSFAKDWMNSSDEGEKLIQYKAGFKTMKVMMTINMFLWLCSFLYMLLFKSGVFFFLLFMLLSIITVVVNSVEVMKLERPEKR